MNREPPHIIVVKGGWLTTVQDLGRYGYQQYGVPVAGAMDSFSAIVANRLVENPDQAALLELTLKGPELQFEQESVIAITGADLSPTINGSSLPLWQSILVPHGSRLSFGSPRVGVRSYLAIAGGIDVPLVLGSRSTHCASEMGGFRGRPLKQADSLCTGKPVQSIKRLPGKRLPDHLVPRYNRTPILRIIPGPQQHFFSDTSLATLARATYTVSPQSDRMGYRLIGPTIVRKESMRFISDCTTMGALQVPPDGQPILLMADRQTTGGYPKIAVVISADLFLAAQLAPGDTVTFAPCTIAQAQTVLRKHRAQLDTALPPQESSLLLR
ncbi:MAG: KipI antagonist [Nitrospira sp. LK265]|nr:biotin-dependent carboxyltransferase family protein [Nitrospira sp.]NGZ60287.1 KipI antagonist [Nitrospira sp. LK265]